MFLCEVVLKICSLSYTVNQFNLTKQPIYGVFRNTAKTNLNEDDHIYNNIFRFSRSFSYRIKMYENVK